MKVYISYPNLDDNKVLDIRARVHRFLTSTFHVTVEPTQFQDYPRDQSIRIADLVILPPGWHTSTICQQDKRTASDYGVNMLILASL